MPHKTDCDILIIGARSAGAAAALLLARRGYRVIVADRADPGSDTLSSHTMTRGAILQLSRWGLLPGVAALGAPAVSRSRFRFAARSEVAIDIRPMADGPGMVAPRRYLLDAFMADAASAAGADIRYRTVLDDVIRDDSGRVTGAILTDPAGSHRITADLVIGADGLRSSLARSVAAPETVLSARALGHVYAYAELPGQVDNFCAFAPGVAMGLTPTNDAMTTVILSTAPSRLKSLMRERGAGGALIALVRDIDPSFAERLSDVPWAGKARLFAGHATVRRRATGPGWALIGDAGQFRDPVSAHGMTDAFRDAELIARTLDEGGPDLATFEAERNAASDPVFTVTAKLTDLDQPPERLQATFMDLSSAMRAEQAWMDDRFRDRALAA